MRKLIMSLCFGVLFLSCRNNTIKEYGGKYTYGHEVRVFKDNETGINYWLNSDDETVQKLNEIMRKKIEDEGKAYSELELEIQGIDEGKAENGFAEPEDRKLKVIEYKIVK
jgi:hypothetical protein